VPDSQSTVVGRLWDEYKSAGTVEARERLILYDAPLGRLSEPERESGPVRD